MNATQRRHQERLVRVRDYVQSLPAPFAANSRGGQALAGISTAIVEAETLDAARATSASTARQGTSQRSDARDALRAQIKAINQTARAVSIDHPEVKDKFRTSPAKLNDQNLLSLARSIVTEATPLKPLFLEYDMPDSFLETLAAAITTFEESISRQNTGAGGRTHARTAIDTAHTRSDVDLERLNTAMLNKYRHDAATLRAWQIAYNVETPQPTHRSTGQPNNPSGGPQS
jgi:hypothetical protein